MGSMSARRAMCLGLWGLVAVVLVGGVVASWPEWTRSGLPDENDDLALQIVNRVFPGRSLNGKGLQWAMRCWAALQGVERNPPCPPIPSRVTFRGWEFRPLDWHRTPPMNTLWLTPETPSREVRPPHVLARPVSPMAKLRYWLGAYPDHWERP